MFPDNTTFDSRLRTLSFPLCVRSLAPERKPTSLFSVACALFHKNTRGGGRRFSAFHSTVAQPAPGAPEPTSKGQTPQSANSHQMNTCASSWHKALGINTCEKHRGWGYHFIFR